MGIEEFDVFVIGTGNSGQKVAIACAEVGNRVGIADSRKYGGVCANRGYDPKKGLVGLTEILVFHKICLVTVSPNFLYSVGRTCRSLNEVSRMPYPM